MRVRAKHLVDKVDDVGPHHGNFIDDDEFDVLNKFPVVGRIFQKIFQFSPLKLRIIGQEWMKRKLEKTVQGTATRIDSRNTRRSQYYIFLFGMLTDVFQKCRLTRSRFSGQKDRLAGILDEFQCILKFGVVGIYQGRSHLSLCLEIHAKIRTNGK